MKRIDLNKEELYDLYIVQNKNSKELSVYYKVSQDCVLANLRRYGIRKDSSKMNESISRAKKNQDNETMVKKLKATMLKKYGSENAMSSSLKNKIDQKVAAKKRSQTLKAMNFRPQDRWKTSSEEINKKIQQRVSEYWKNRSKEEMSNFRKNMKEIMNSFTPEQYKEWNLKAWETTKELGLDKRSYKELELLSFIQSIYNGKIITGDRTILNGQEIDIYIPDLKTGIEFNGTYWHSSLYKDKYYHRNKTLECEKKGIRLIHIYEWEWDNQKENIQTFLKFVFNSETTRIYARKCQIKDVPRDVYHQYCRENHLQGAKSGTKDLVVLGLYYQDELVQLMSFDKPARSKKYQWEIIRGCPGSMNHVIGGNSKLFSHFVKTYNPQNIMSKCDMDKFDGRGYYALGMKKVEWQERKYDVFVKEGKVIATSYVPRQQVNRIQRELDMKNGNGLSVYSAGTLEFLWKQ